MISRLLPNRVRRTYLGGSRIDAFTGFAPPADGMLRPEDWLASTTTAFNGTAEIAGEGLGRLEDGRTVLEAVGELPMLVKLLDSDERLVVQAHPTVPFARERFHSPVGKTECWYFLPGTALDACVYLGFKPGITRAAWRRAFETQEGLLGFLHRIPVRSGDFVFVEGGVPHAIGAGCFLVELQEPSDLMVVAERVTPSGRQIPDGKIFGGLDLDGMLGVYDYAGLPCEEMCARYVRRGANAGPSVVRIAGPELTDKFSMWLVSGGQVVETAGRPAVAVVTEGRGTVNAKPVSRGDRLVIVGERTVEVGGDAKVVACFGHGEPGVMQRKGPVGT